MASQTWSLAIDNMFTSTWAYRKEGAIEQAYEKTPFWDWLNRKGKIKDISGHSRIEINLEYGENETVTWLGKGGTVPMTEGDLLTVCYDDWKYVAVTILRFGTEDQQNRGKARIVNYVERKERRAERALDKDFERVCFADGTGDNEPNGLQNLIPDDPTTGTIHGINRATAGNEFFRSLQYSSSGVTSVYLLSDMRTALNNMTIYEGIETSDIFLYTTQAIYEAYEDELLEVEKYTSAELVKAKYESLVFKSRPIMWAPSCPTGNMYYINPEYLYAVKDPDFFMDMTEWKAIPDQVNDKVAQILCTFQMVCSRPVSQQVMTGITVG
jgi:hypothetical protein